MAGQTYTKLIEGARCIIHINRVNSPTGWWWGIIDSIKWNESQGGWGSVTAHITGPFQFAPGVASGPMYGAEDIKLTTNFTVYGADQDTVSLVRWLLRTEEKGDAKIQRLRLVNGELRSILNSMAISPDKITEAVEKALQCLK